MWSGHGSGLQLIQADFEINAKVYMFGCSSVAVEQPALEQLIVQGCCEVAGCC